MVNVVCYCCQSALHVVVVIDRTVLFAVVFDADCHVCVFSIVKDIYSASRVAVTVWFIIGDLMIQSQQRVSWISMLFTAIVLSGLG